MTSLVSEESCAHYAIAQSPFLPLKEDEMTINRFEVAQVAFKSERKSKKGAPETWLFVERKEKKGFIPVSFVEVIDVRGLAVHSQKQFIIDDCSKEIFLRVHKTDEVIVVGKQRNEWLQAINRTTMRFGLLPPDFLEDDESFITPQDYDLLSPPCSPKGSPSEDSRGWESNPKFWFKQLEGVCFSLSNLFGKLKALSYS